METSRWYPCDDFVPDPVLSAWRGVTVRAGAEQVWPWLGVPVGDGLRTRLLLKVVTAGGRIIAPLLSIGDLIMARRQLLNLAAPSERTAAS